MTKPKDMDVADRVGMVRVARHISNVISPPNMFAAVGLALGIYSRPFWPGLVWGFFYGVMTSLTPILFVFFLLYTGRIGDLHMSAKQERNLPYIVAIVAAIIALAVILVLDGPVLLRCLTIFNIVELTALSLINTRWLISIHAAAAASTWLISALVFGWGVGLVLLPLVVLICWVRVFLKRHTPAQVAAGVGLGMLTVLAMRLLGCFVA